MYRLYPITVALIIESCNTAVIHSEHVKFNANGNQTVTQRSDFVQTGPGMVKVYILDDKKAKGEVTKNVTAGTSNLSITSNSPIVIKVNKADATKPADVDTKKEEEDSANKVNTQSNDKSSHPKLVYMTNNKELSSKNKEKSSKKKELAANIIETRRISKFNVYVPISEDINPSFDEDHIGKGVGRRGLSLVDLEGNILRIPV